MRASPISALRLLAAASCAALLAVNPAAFGRDADLAFEQANEKWADAPCRNRIPLKIKKGRDGEGWSRGPYMVAATPGDKGFMMIFKVSDRDAARALMAGDTIPPGTRFVCRGWRPRNDRGNEGIVLDLRFRDLPVDARLVAVGTKHRKFDQVERYARIQAFQLEAADEQLADAPTRAAAATEGTTSRGGEMAPGESGQGAYRPTVRVLSTSVRPPRAARGTTIKLIVTYELLELPPGGTAEIRESREVWRDDELVLRDEQSFARAAGMHTTELEVRADVVPGLYELRASVGSAGVVSSATAIFEIE